MKRAFGSTSPRPARGAWLGCLLGSLLTVPVAMRATENGNVTAVSARAADDYVRVRQADGHYDRETYAFGEGGRWNGARNNPSLERLTFKAVARTVSRPLAQQDYVAATDPKQTKLLIMVYWGATTGSADQQNTMETQDLQTTNSQLNTLQNTPNADPAAKAAAEGAYNSALALNSLTQRNRDRTDARNASMLGYDSAGVIGTDYGRQLRLTAFHRQVEDLTEEIADNRYFVVLMAYDFQLLWKEKKRKLLWETRFSVRERNNNFEEVLPEMAQLAARYFGQNSGGLVRKPLPAGTVRLDEMKILGVEPDAKPAP